MSIDIGMPKTPHSSGVLRFRGLSETAKNLHTLYKKEVKKILTSFTKYVRLFL